MLNRMVFMKIFTLMILHLLLLPSCNKKEDIKPITNESYLGGGATSNKPILDLKGKEWLTSCLKLKDEDGEEVLRYKTKIVFKNETQFSSTTTQYLLTGCSDENKDFTWENSGTYEISNNKITFNMTNFYETPHSEYALSINSGFNNIPEFSWEEDEEPICILPVPYCGIHDWEIGVRKELTGLTCGEEVLVPFTATFNFQAGDDSFSIDEDGHEIVYELVK